jgi:hypothetical protein
VQSLTKELDMKVARMGTVAAMILAVATLAWAQKADFSGTWTLDPDASGTAAGAPGGGGGGMGRGGGRGGTLGMGPATVKQTADALTIERTVGENKVVTTYKLDGSESKNTMTGRGGMTIESTSVAKWDGPKLVITSKQAMGDQTFETTETWTLAGNVLTVESTNARGTTKRVYRK